MPPSARGASLPQHILISEKERLSQMLYTNPVFSFQICNRPRHTDNADGIPAWKALPARWPVPETPVPQVPTDSILKFPGLN